MASGAGAVIAGVLGAGALALVASKGAHAKGLTPKTLDKKPDPKTGRRFKTPTDVEVYVAQALASEDPSTMDAAADVLDAEGYHDEARLLRTEAEGIRRGSQVVPVPPPSPPPKPGAGADTKPLPRPPARVEPTPIRPEDHFYEVQARGESFWSIAQLFTGNGNRYTELMAVNKDKKPPPPATWLGEQLRLPKSWPATPPAKGSAPAIPPPAPAAAPRPPPPPPPPPPGFNTQSLPSLPAAAPAVPEDPKRVVAQALTDHLKSLGGLAARYHEDKARVKAFQVQEALNADGNYGPGTSIRILEKYGIIPVAPLYWSKTKAAAQKREYLARVRQLGGADPQRASEYEFLIKEATRS